MYDRGTQGLCACVCERERAHGACPIDSAVVGCGRCDVGLGVVWEDGACVCCGLPSVVAHVSAAACPLLWRMCQVFKEGLPAYAPRRPAGDSTAGVPKMRASTAGAADVQLGHTHRDHDPPRDPIPTHCAGLQRKMQLRLDANGATIWRSTHPKKFSSVYPHLKYGWPIEVDGVQFVCSLCNQGICCQRPEVGESWEEKARTIGGSDNHSSSCVAKQRRNGISVDQGDAATKHLTGVRSFHNKKLAPPPLPEDAQTLRKSYPIPPFSVIRMDLDAFQKRSKQVRDPLSPTLSICRAHTICHCTVADTHRHRRWRGAR